MNDENLNKIQDTETAKTRGSNGGKKSGVARRKKRDAKDVAIMFLQLACSGNLDQYLEQLGVEERDRTNLTAVIARHTLQGQQGNVNSARFVLETAGYIGNSASENNFNVNIGKEDDKFVIVVPDNYRDNEVNN